MNVSNAPILPVTTQPQQVAHQVSDYTCNCDAITKAEAYSIGCVSTLTAGIGSFLGAAVWNWTAAGALIGLSSGAACGGAAVTGTIFYLDGCRCIQLRERQIATCTERVSLAVGQQQSQELPPAAPPPSPETDPIGIAPPPYPGIGLAPPPYPGTGPNCTAPVQSRPRMWHSSLLLGVAMLQSPIPQTIRAASDIARGRSIEINS
ncbi:hypothetical protein [Endozoicomonas sp. YOMI1]|uniref:hypothetical protein n=1 Tax=Endozoicomonas sp. YOMI1 TaxID=2828739 RepID=UPI002147873A|nr:hypothetical protein [Endozoicomonas sp. YOMI1]